MRRERGRTVNEKGGEVCVCGVGRGKEEDW